MAAGMRVNDRIDDGLAALDEAEPLATASALALELSRLHHLRGNLLFPLGRDADCVREHELARRLRATPARSRPRQRRWAASATATTCKGGCARRTGSSTACVAMARAHGFGRLEVANLSMIGWTGMHLAELSAAVGVGHEAIELACALPSRAPR